MSAVLSAQQHLDSMADSGGGRAIAAQVGPPGLVPGSIRRYTASYGLRPTTWPRRKTAGPSAWSPPLAGRFKFQQKPLLERGSPASRAISSTATPDSDMTATNVCREPHGAHTPSIPAFLQRVRKSRRTCEASSGVPTLLVNTRPESGHSSPAASRALACRFRCSRSAATALCGKARVCRDFSALVSPCNKPLTCGSATKPC